MRALVLGLVVFGCTRSHEASKADDCDAFLAHIDALTRTPHKPPTASQLEYCRKRTDEQRRCAFAATTVPDFSLCDDIADPKRRELARKVQTSIMATWRGSTDLHGILNGEQGCAFVGVAGRIGFVLDETRAVVNFATHEVQHATATFVRDGEAWKCTEADPPATCESLARLCAR